MAAMIIGRHPALVPAWRLGRGRAALVAIVSLAFGIVFALNLLSLLTPPRLSFVLDASAAGQTRVAWVLSGGTLWGRGVRPGELVLALDGRAPRTGEAGLWVGARVIVRAPSGRTAAVDARAIQSGSTWPLLVLSPWFLLLGTLIVLRTPRLAVGRAAYALFASAAFVLALAPGVDGDELPSIMGEIVTVTLLSIFFVRFFLTFPRPLDSPRLRAFVPIPALLSLTLGLVALLWPDLHAADGMVGGLVTLAYLLTGAGLLVYGFVTTREPSARAGLAVIAAGTVASVLPLIALYFVPTLFGHPALLASEQATLALALLPACFAYAILRYQALDMRLLQRWLVHGLLLTVLLVFCVAAVYARRWLPLGVLPEPRRTFALALLFVLLGGTCFGPLYGRLWRYLDHHIFKDSYDYRASLQGLSRDISLVGDLDALGASLPDTLRRMMTSTSPCSSSATRAF